MDLPCDIRDLTADFKDISQGNDIPWWLPVADLIALLPGIGVIKYGDEIGTAAKGVGKKVSSALEALGSSKNLEKEMKKASELLKKVGKGGDVGKAWGKSGRKADLGNKLDYQFGKAGGNKHNIDRTNGLKAEMDKLGFDDTVENRAYFEEYYNDVLNDSSNIVGAPVTASYTENGVTHYYTVTTRESFLMGKYGGAKVTTYWDGNRLLTIKICSGNQTRYNH